MTWLATAALIIGSVVITAAGFAVAAFALWLSARATGKFAWRTWKNMTAIYDLHTMRYWFKRIEKEGARPLRNYTFGTDGEKGQHGN